MSWTGGAKHSHEEAVEPHSLHYATPNFLSSLLVLIHFMRLSSRRGAHEALSSATWQKSGYAPAGGCDLIDFPMRPVPQGRLKGWLLCSAVAAGLLVQHATSQDYRPGLNSAVPAGLDNKGEWPIKSQSLLMNNRTLID
jgi:hypothetical protein